MCNSLGTATLGLDELSRYLGVPTSNPLPNRLLLLLNLDADDKISCYEYCVFAHMLANGQLRDQAECVWHVVSDGVPPHRTVKSGDVESLLEGVEEILTVGGAESPFAPAGGVQGVVGVLARDGKVGFAGLAADCVHSHSASELGLLERHRGGESSVWYR